MMPRSPLPVAPTANPTRQRRWAASLVTGAFLAVALGAAPATAADPPPPLSQVILCDATGCYVAWRVVDSDRDGISDADEIMAGTDPHDPKSHPLLVHIAELGYAHKLPSFEAGLGAFVVMPAEIVKMRNEGGVDLLAAFPMADRADALTRMGISLEQLAQHGINADRDGFSIGLDAIGSKDAPAGRRVGGIDASLISAGGDPPRQGLAHGGAWKVGKNIFGEDVVVNRDGTWSTSRTEAGTTTTDHFNADDSLNSTSVRTVEEGTDGDIKIHKETNSTTSADGRRLSQVTSERHSYADGTHSTLTVTTEYLYDADGNCTGTLVTTTLDSTSADGADNSSHKQVESCDASGKNCTEAPPREEESDHGHYDPEYGPVIITQEMVDGVLRFRGATINVVRNWTAPGLEDDPKDPRNPSVVALVDSDLEAQFLLIEPIRITEAQPEFRDDLPSPLDAAPPPQTGGCSGLC